MKRYIVFMFAVLWSVSGFSQTHFTSAHAGTGSESQMNIYVLSGNIHGENLQAGDEIGLFDGSICTGAELLSSEFSTGIISLIADKSDEEILNGYTSGHPITVKIWDSSASTEYIATVTFDPESPNSVYTDNGSAWVNIFVPIPLTINLTAQDKTYDGTDDAIIGYSVIGGTIASGDDVSVSVNNGKFNNKNVGTTKPVTATINISGDDAFKYDFTVNNSTTADITARLIIISADAKSKTYGEPDPVLTAQVSSGTIVSGDVVSGTLERVVGSAVNTYAINQGTYTYGSNYYETFVSANLTINKTMLIITADNQKKIYDGLPFTGFTVSYEGFVYNETESILGGTLNFGGTAVTASEPGTGYIITPSGLTSGNYEISFQNGTLDILSVPDKYEVDESLTSSDDVCFDAIDTIFVAKSKAVVFSSGSISTLIAGKSIFFLPGFHAEEGSNMDAQITTDGSFCDMIGKAPALYSPEEKSADLKINVEKSVIDDSEIGIKIYPNPNEGLFKVEITGGDENDFTIQVYNLTGKAIYTGKNGKYFNEINLSNSQKGLYILRISASGKIFSRKIIVQ
jgi:hypothetical protein